MYLADSVLAVLLYLECDPMTYLSTY